MGLVRRTSLVAAVLGMLVTATAADARQRPLITDPEGDANWASCGWFTVLPPPCSPLGSGASTSQPVIDVLTGEFATRRQSLLVDIGVLDLAHPIIDTYGARPDDRTTYAVWFSIEDRVSVELRAERDTTGAVVVAQLSAWGPDGWSQTTRPISAVADVAHDRMRLDVSLAALNDALREVCLDCPEVRRGTELRMPFAFTTITSRDSLGFSYYPATDGTWHSGSYFVGD